MACHRWVFAALVCLWQPAISGAQSFWERAVDGEHSVLSTEYSVLSTEYSVRSLQHDTTRVGDDDNTLRTQYSVLSTEYPILSPTESELLQYLYASPGPLAVIRDEAINGTRGFLTRVALDFEHQYTGRRLYVMGGTVAVAAVLANTHADQGFRDWYQGHLRSTTTDEIARISNFMGDHYLTGTVAMSAWGVGRLAERLLEDRPLGRAGAWVGDWGNRTMRGMFVGCPTVGVLQVALGASRPDENRGSQWHPFRDSNSVSGHVFVGAVPFLTAMRMTEYRPLQSTFFAGSFLIVLGRINNDDHYLSQVMLGWMIALLATGSVADTDAEVPYRWRIVPVEVPNGAGLGVEFRF